MNGEVGIPETIVFGSVLVALPQHQEVALGVLEEGLGPPRVPGYRTLDLRLRAGPLGSAELDPAALQLGDGCGDVVHDKGVVGELTLLPGRWGYQPELVPAYLHRGPRVLHIALSPAFQLPSEPLRV